jgi:threonyl-tRNA synthetase
LKRFLLTDFSYKRPFTPDDLVTIEKKMAELAKQDIPVYWRVLPGADE